MKKSDNARGIWLVTIGILVLSPDGLLIRLIDLNIWSVVFLRGCFMAISLFALNFFVNKEAPLRQFYIFDRYAWGIVVMMAFSNYFFVFSIQNTSVAHTLIIVGSAPVVAAILGLLFLREKVSVNTWLTIFIVITGLAFVVNDGKQSNFKGDMYALIACVLWSANFVMARKTRMKNMVAPLCVSSVLIVSYSLPFSELAAMTLNQLLLGMLLGLLVGIAFSLITLAPRYIPAAEVAVFMPIEAVVGSLLVWLFLGEYPGLISLLAGMVIILAIMLNSYYQIKIAQH